MKVEITHNDITYHLTNSGLKVGDKVFPVSEGHTKDGKYIHTGIWLTEYFTNGQLMCGLPDEPHTIQDLDYSDDKAYQIRTDKEFGPVEEYFKIIKQ